MSDMYIKFGELLVLERERQGLKLEAIADELKIAVSHLQALEQGNKDEVPSGTYFTLFAKTYAEYLGIDYTRTMEAIETELADEPDPEEEAAQTEAAVEVVEEPPRTTASKRLLYGLAVLVIGVGIMYGTLHFLIQGGGETADGGSGVLEFNPEQVAKFEGVQWGQASHTMPDSLILMLESREPSWASVYADGDTALYQNLTPGRRYRIAAQYRMLVNVGIPRVVDVTLNGKSVDLVDPETRRISWVEINQANKDAVIEGLQEVQAAVTTAPEPPVTQPVVDLEAVSDSVEATE